MFWKDNEITIKMGCPILGILTYYLADVLHQGLVSGHLGLLHDRNTGSDPSDEDKFGTFAHFITSLEWKNCGFINMSHLTISLNNSYLNSNVSESPIIIAKMRLEVGELLASGSHTQAVVLVEFENSPAKKIGTLQ